MSTTCPEGKIQYASPQDAQKAVDSMRRRGAKVRQYRCERPGCNAWHVTQWRKW